MADAYGTLARCLSVGILNSSLTFYTYFCISMSFTCFCIRWQLQLYLVSHDFEWIGKFELVSDFQENSIFNRRWTPGSYSESNILQQESSSEERQFLG